nr:MAG TPA: hypothetical protein [Caudoviricetes sp.]
MIEHDILECGFGLIDDFVRIEDLSSIIISHDFLLILYNGWLHFKMDFKWKFHSQSSDSSWTNRTVSAYRTSETMSISPDTDTIFPHPVQMRIALIRLAVISKSRALTSASQSQCMRSSTSSVVSGMVLLLFFVYFIESKKFQTTVQLRSDFIHNFFPHSIGTIAGRSKVSIMAIYKSECRGIGRCLGI